uniref:Tetratricopeptide repeat protein n=1 Tax=Chryseobacterium endophyticum TaxID=1854762 RepID=A0AAU6WT87_9FLAO
MKKLPRKLALVWDNSLSGKRRDHTKEWALLERYFKTNTSLTVKIYFLNNTFEEGQAFTIGNGNWAALKDYLSETVYDGGTDFSQLKSVKEDEILFFTDGMSSFGDLKLSWNKPTYTISSSGSINASQLKFISNATGGEFLNLNENDPAKEVRKLLVQPLKFLGIEGNDDLSEVYPSLPQTISQDFMLTGILKGNQSEVLVKFGYGNEVTETRTISLDPAEQTVKDWEISKFWAQKKLNELEIFEKKNKETIKEISRQFGLVSNNMSLMVLENVQDYVRYDIPPPVELRSAYDQIVKNNRSMKDERVKDLMADAEMMIEDLKAWWKKDYTRKENQKRYPEPGYNGTSDSTGNQRIEEVVMIGASRISGNSSMTVADAAPQADQAVDILGSKSKDIQEVVVTEALGMRKSAEMTAASSVVQSLQGRVSGISVSRASEYKVDSVKTQDISQVVSSGRINVIDVKSSAEYMKLFEKAKDAETIYNVYLDNRSSYENLPQYYFDVAQLLFSIKDKKSGLIVLSSIADLDIENEELYKLLAYKLKQAEVYDKELFVTQKVLEWRPFDPQSYRDYALALEDNGQYQQALDHLYSILMQSYTKELADRDDGIEETLLMEINGLISRYGKN